jgi:transposase-like protein
MVVLIQGRDIYLWQAEDSEGEILDILIQRRRDKTSALKLMCKLFKKQGFIPSMPDTGKLGSYGATRRKLGLSAGHGQGLYENNRVEISHQVVRRREQKMKGFKSPGPA